MIIHATLDSHIRVKDSDIPEEISEDLIEALSFENRAREAARKDKRWGWMDMPKEICLWEEVGDTILIPRGFRWRFEDGLKSLGHQIEWEDNRTYTSTSKELPEFDTYRPQQQQAAEKILQEEDGIYEAPAGSGKTVAVLEIIRRAQQQHNIVVVNEIGIAEQWKDAANQFIPGMRCGIIGDAEWDEQQLTIATQQTLNRKKEELGNRWWRKWGLACLDECHHQTARTFKEVMSRFWAKYRFGVSATPDKTGDFEWAEIILGEIVHRNTRHQLVDYGILVRPTIRVVETDFEFDFHSTFKVRKIEKCPLPECDKEDSHMHRNNYAVMTKALKNDSHRNSLIVRCINQHLDSRQLVTSAQSSQLAKIRKLTGGCSVPVLDLTGKESRKERMWVKDAIEDGPCLVFATIAKEAFDAPKLEVLHRPWPTKNLGAVRQEIGRVERAAEGKKFAIVYDYADLKQPVLAIQYADRRWGCYAEELYRVEHYHP